MNEYKWNKLFREVWRNIVLFKLIFRHVRLFDSYRGIKFNNRKQLLDFPDREFLISIVYNGKDELLMGDLPIGSALKEVKIVRPISSLIKGEFIPQTVEIIHYSKENKTTTPFSRLPSSIHTVYNSVGPKLASDVLNTDFNIPFNITSISFLKCPNISSSNIKGNGYIVIPNTIKKLEFKYNSNWNNEGIVLRPGDLPINLTSLSMKSYEVFNLTKGVLPNSIKHLEITCFSDFNNDNPFNYSNGYFNFLTPNLESMDITCHCNITPESKLNSSKSIKKLSIGLNNNEKLTILPNSLPESINDLTIYSFTGNLELNTIPNSVTSLILFHQNPNNDQEIISNGSIPNNVVSLKLLKPIYSFPNSLTNFEFGDFHGYHSNETIFNMLLKLPKSLTSIKLPKRLKDDINFINSFLTKTTIKEINYQLN